jgi:O-methyltransferase
MIKKILYFLDEYIDLNVLREILHQYRFFIFKIKYIIQSLLLSDKQKKKKKIILNSLPYSMAGIEALDNCYEMTNYINKRNLKGDICEFGVAKGGCSLAIALTERLINNKLKRNIFLFDSFAGLPAPSIEKDFDNQGSIGKVLFPMKKGSLASEMKEVQDLFYNKYNFPKNKIIFIKGFFEETAKNYKNKIGNLSMLRLDGDWYYSVYIPLKFYYKKLVSGGVIIVDDYRTCVGAKNAVKDFGEQINTKFDIKNYGKGGIYFLKP